MEKSLVSFYMVRFNDCDPFGHLNNASYFNYFLNAREDQVNIEFKNILKNTYEAGKSWVIARHEIRYIRPVNYGENICITSLLLEISEMYLDVEMTMWDNSRKSLKAILWTRFVHISLSTGTKERHAEIVMNIFRPWEDKSVVMALGLDVRINTLKKLV